MRYRGWSVADVKVNRRARRGRRETAEGLPSALDIEVRGWRPDLASVICNSSVHLTSFQCSLRSVCSSRDEVAAGVHPPGGKQVSRGLGCFGDCFGRGFSRVDGSHGSDGLTVANIIGDRPRRDGAGVTGDRRDPKTDTSLDFVFGSRRSFVTPAWRSQAAGRFRVSTSRAGAQLCR